MIECRNLIFKYTARENQEEKIAINDVNLQIKEGEFIAILGHNGSGKSTMAKHMNALLIPTEGKMLVNKMDTSDMNNLWNIRETAGMVFQNPDNQLVATIVEEDVAFGPENLGVPPEEIRKRVDEALERVGMSEYKRHAPHLLSGGQKQRIAIAGILAMKPKCIIFDEPTAMLDPSGRKEVLDTIIDLNKNYGITVILITHYMDEAAKADRIVVMDKGKLILDGKPRDVFSNVEKMKSIGLDVPQVTELSYELHKAGIGTEVVKTVGKEKVLSEDLVSAHREQPSVTENKIVHYGNENINLNDLRNAAKINLMGDAGVNGDSLNNLKESKEWKRSGEHGRATTIGDISVERLKDEQGKVIEGKYKMSAVIDGNVISHEINQKDFNKFLAVNDYQRMKLFDKIFPEVEMKTKPGHGFNLGAAILAAVTTGLDVAAGLSMAAPPRPKPDFYESRAVFSKPGVVSPEAVAAASYAAEIGEDRGHGEGRGMGV